MVVLPYHQFSETPELKLSFLFSQCWVSIVNYCVCNYTAVFILARRMLFNMQIHMIFCNIGQKSFKCHIL
jgi:hypothetical protein